MSEIILTDVKAYRSGYDIGGNMNSATLKYRADLKDRTVYGTTTRTRKPGLKDVNIEMSGFWDNSSSGFDSSIYSDVGSTEEVTSIIPQGTGVGYTAYFTQGVQADYNLDGKIGEMFPFKISMHGNKPLVRGRVMESGTLSSDLTETVQTLGVRTLGKRLMCGVHILGVSSSDAGCTLDIITDNTTDFSGTPSTAITITISDTDVGVGRWASTGSSTGDDNYRVDLTMTTTDDSITGVVVLGIGDS